MDTPKHFTKLTEDTEYKEFKYIINPHGNLELAKKLEPIIDNFTLPKYCTMRRDNCKIINLNVQEELRRNGFDPEIVGGYFIVDNINLVDAKDLKTLHSYNDWHNSGLSKSEYVKSKNYLDKDLGWYTYIPHYWLELDGLIIDRAWPMFNKALEKPITKNNYSKKDYNESINEELAKNEFYHCSNNPNLKASDITEGIEGFHITKNLDSALDRSRINNRSNSFLYKIKLNSSLHPLTFTMDIFRWNSCTLARFILAAINQSKIGQGFDEDVDGNPITINNYIKDNSKLLLLEKDIGKLAEIKNEKESSKNLKTIFDMLKSIGYNSIKYVNQAEGNKDSIAYILFNNELISNVEKITDHVF